MHLLIVRVHLLIVEDDVRLCRVLERLFRPDRHVVELVSSGTDALAARAEAATAFTTLFVGLGAVALIVGGVGIANVMLMSVMERRPEIGLRRALGARRVHITLQVLAEALVLAAIGGCVGVLLGNLVAAGYATLSGLPVVVPPIAVVGGFLAAIAIGAVAGLYPAFRAARVSPTEALRGG